MDEINLKVSKELLKDETFDFDKWLGEQVEYRIKRLGKENKYNLEKIIIYFE